VIPLPKFVDGTKAERLSTLSHNPILPDIGRTHQITPTIAESLNPSHHPVLALSSHVAHLIMYISGHRLCRNWHQKHNINPKCKDPKGQPNQHAGSDSDDDTRLSPEVNEIVCSW
jgi:hypothetical protein